MSVTYISELLTREEFFDKAYQRGKSKAYQKLTKSALSNFDTFCLDKYGIQTQTIMKDLKEEIKKTQDVTKVLKLLQDFVDWLAVDHANLRTKNKQPIKSKVPQAIRNYVSRTRKYMKLCEGIKIDTEDFVDYVVIPADENDEEPEPLLKEELKLIVENITNPRRRVMVMFMKDTRARILETMRVKKKYFDLTKDPVMVVLPKAIVKGKTKKRTLFLTRETTPGIKQLLKNLDPEDFVFATSENEETAVSNEERFWNRLMKKPGINFSDRYQSGHLKKNIHSIGSFNMTALKEATKDPDYAHGYGGHKRYLEQYIRLPLERQIQLFKQSEPNLSIFEDRIVVEDNERMKAIEEKLEKYEMLDKLIENIEQPKLEELLQNLSKLS